MATIEEGARRDPAVVRAYFQEQHAEGAARWDDDSDQVLDWFLDLGVAGIEHELYQDVEALTTAIPGEQLGYQGTPYAAISDFLRALSPTREDVFYDLGAGYGRPTLMAAMLTDARVVGIEIVPERVARAQEVAARLDLANVTYRLGSVVDPAIGLQEGTIFFLFNPFNEGTLQKALARLRGVAATKRARGERLRVVVLGRCTSAFEGERAWLRFVRVIDGAHLFESV